MTNATLKYIHDIGHSDYLTTPICGIQKDQHNHLWNIYKTEHIDKFLLYSEERPMEEKKSFKRYTREKWIYYFMLYIKRINSELTL